MPAVRRDPIGFAEVPEFHVEVARQADPSLAKEPLVVGGDPEKRGKVVAASADLRARGIVDGMPVDEALERASDARWARTDLPRARELSGRLRAAVREEVESIEVEGLAGFYLRAPREPESARELGRRLEARVRLRVDLPLRFGVAPVRYAARLAAEEAGRGGVRIIGPDEFEAWLQGQPLERLPGVGPKTAARLAELGAVDVPGLRDLGLERLDVLLGNHGRTLWLLACGEDPKPLRAKRHPASLSREETFDPAPTDLARLESTIARLAESLSRGLRRDGLRAGRLALRLTGPGERTITRSRALDTPGSEASLLAETARELLDRVEVEGRAFRRLGLVVRGLEASGAEDRQLDLF